MRRGVLLVVVVLALAGVVVPAEKQDPRAELAQFFGDVEVSIFNLEVFATDKSGQSVSGLALEDFELLVDGEPTPILNFYEGHRVRWGEPEDQGEEGEGPAEATESPLPPPEDQRLYIVVFIDNTSIRPSSRNRVIGKLREVLDANIGPNDRVLLVTQGPGLEIRHGFSDPADELGGVLDVIELEIGGTGQFNSERYAIIAQLKRARALQPGSNVGSSVGSAFIADEIVSDARSVLDRIRTYQQWRYDTVRLGANAMAGFLDALSGLEGRKALLYVGEGSAFRVAESLFMAWEEKYQYTWEGLRSPPSDLATLSAPFEANRRNLRRVFEAVGARASASRVTFYAIDAGAEFATTQSSAEHPGYSGASMHETTRLMHQQQSLQLLANTTGGRYFTNLENVEGVVASLADDFSNYYSLGFAPKGPPDREYHDIEVKVRRPGVRVRHRAGFRAKSLGDFMADRLQAALNLDVAPNPLGVTVISEKARKMKKSRYRIRLLARIPMANLLLVPQADEHLGRVTVWVAASNLDGDTTSAHSRRLPIRVPRRDLLRALKQEVGYAVDLTIRGGRQRVAVIVRDELSLVSSIVTIDLEDGRGVPLEPVRRVAVEGDSLSGR
jgi:VWFA-related protein